MATTIDVLILMGSDSDAAVMQAAAESLIPGLIPLMAGDLIHEGKAAKGRLVATNHCN